MDKRLRFHSRDEFREWLKINCIQSESVWLIFEKGKYSTTLSAQDALEEALCFGWIDGQLGKRNDSDDTAYIKKFSPRRKKSKWSERNKKLTEKLIHSGLMTEYGLKAIENAKRDGTWDSPRTKDNSTETILLLESALAEVPEILDKFKYYPPSGRKTLSYYYADAQKEETKKKRLNLIIEAIKCDKKSVM
ncbi:YdeI/OmpD-associated family protein [Marispirochaeta aestuarii]|uniref:YdeI/OmpD-associated family protein n=1 Tax=Marispirochaeta aestuarii TaxID=1963862 RepID=UPI0029C7E5B0|nr:YdeI/OmpD-associated family protein [Marispirochaeta aestuarii]